MCFGDNSSFQTTRDQFCLFHYVKRKQRNILFKQTMKFRTTNVKTRCELCYTKGIKPPDLTDLCVHRHNVYYVYIVLDGELTHFAYLTL